MFLALLIYTVCLGFQYAEIEESDTGDYSGYWIGSGATWQKLADDPIRKVTRRSETQFWFVVDGDGNVTGEGYISYQAEMQAMKWKVPIPKAGSIEAEVAGGSEKVTRRYGIEGSISTEGQLVLRVVGESAQMTIPGAEFEFAIHATWSAPVGIAGLESTAGLKVIEIKVPAKAWSPFQGKKPSITQHQGGPHVVDVSESNARFGLSWHAIQMVSPRFLELERRVRALERHLNQERTAQGG
jgi:hypothetical protein